jgi:hypothetical protein
MDRTLRAVVAAAVIAFTAVAGLGVFLGFDPTGSVIAGVVASALAGLLVGGASRRAESFHPTPVEPRFPGPPDRPDGSPADPPEERPDR